MLWPIVLPLKITFCILAGLVALVTMLAPAFRCKRAPVFIIAAGLACTGFVPSCTAVMAIVDARRFGVFEYATLADVDDFRVRRYLPTEARQITVEKFASGNRAKYSISESELMEYLDGLWDQYGSASAITRDRLNDGASVRPDVVAQAYGDLGWPVLENAIELHSPVESDGGGANYFFDREKGIAYHRAGYW